jgi:hypothetical protein
MSSMNLKLEKIGKEESFSRENGKTLTLRYEKILGIGGFGSAFKVTDLSDNTRLGL